MSTPCLNPEQVEDEWITTYGMASGNFDITKVDSRFTDKVQSPTQMGKVYARLISSVDTEDNLPATMKAVYASPVCDKIDRDCREMPKKFSTFLTS